jgi:hypothetical protein
MMINRFPTARTSNGILPASNIETQLKLLFEQTAIECKGFNKLYKSSALGQVGGTILRSGLMPELTQNNYVCRYDRYIKDDKWMICAVPFEGEYLTMSSFNTLERAIAHLDKHVDKTKKVYALIEIDTGRMIRV